MLLSIYPPQAIILFLPSSTSIDYPVWRKKDLFDFDVRGIDSSFAFI
jgi:hypothetical protein